MSKLAAIAALCLSRGTMTPVWINPNQGVELKPPADVMKLGDKRSAENLTLIAKTLCYSTAKRYAPNTVTYCNIATSDFCQIAKAPLPHLFDPDGAGPKPPHEMRANMMYTELNNPTSEYGKKWTKTGTVASALAVKNLAQVGIPQVAVWFNPTGGPGHIMPIIPKPAGKVDKPGACGIWVAGAGRHCTDGCPIEDQFGKYLKDTLFFAYNG